MPHPQTHKKAHLLSIQAFAVYILLFVFFQNSVQYIQKIRPDVLGIDSSVTKDELINLTNIERQKNGLPPVAEDSRLDEAAKAKGQNMFAENYWAHFSPSGKDPWGFIQGAGYRYTYAGENLARNFYTSKEVVDAWMASPTHRDNIVNSHYRNIGIAVLQGTLSGQNTILVVQEFGTLYEAVAEAPKEESQVLARASSPPESTPSSQTLPAKTAARPVLVASKLELKPEIDAYFLTKYTALSLIFLLAVLLVIDLYIIRRRAVVRISSRHLPHLALLAVAASVILNSVPGSITASAVETVMNMVP